MAGEESIDPIFLIGGVILVPIILCIVGLVFFLLWYFKKKKW